MYESRRDRPLPRAAFIRRLLRHALAILLLIAGSLALGMAGYMHFEQLSPMDAFLNAAMLLGGMGPVDAPRTGAGKLFAGCYALYAGLAFLLVAAVMFTPLLHRLLHRFHWTEDER
jgi:hypothetical protein